MIKENRFQHELITKIKMIFPEAVVLKNDANYIQGFPDLLVLNKNRYAVLEVKRSKSASHQPNQDYYISHFAPYAFSAFVYPENEQEVLDGLSSYFAEG